MLSMIVGLIQNFQRRHGIRPQRVCLNELHMKALREECPALFENPDSRVLGFHIHLLSEYELPHPRVEWIPDLPPVSAPVVPPPGRHAHRKATVLPFRPSAHRQNAA